MFCQIGMTQYFNGSFYLESIYAEGNMGILLEVINLNSISPRYEANLQSSINIIHHS